MPRAYSVDLRERVVAARREEALTEAALAARFRVSETTVYNSTTGCAGRARPAASPRTWCAATGGHQRESAPWAEHPPASLERPPKIVRRSPAPGARRLHV